MAEIILNIEPNGIGELTFYPGDILKGNAELRVHSPKRMREFYIHIIGLATARWTSEGFNSTISYFSELYRHRANNRFQNYTVIGEEKGPKFILESGVYKCHYLFELPANIPYSLAVSGGTFSSSHGNIAYRVEAVIDKPYKLCKQVGFSVVRNDDLNLYPKLKYPLRCVEKKNFFFFFNKDKTLHRTVSIPYSGFIANQRIPITVAYKNDSTVNIDQTIVKFIKVLTLVLPREGNPKIRKKKEVLLTGSTVGVQARSSKTFTIDIIVPKVLKSNDKFCHVVTLTYFVEIIAEVNEGYHTNKIIRLPVTIGNVPIRFDDQTQQQPAPSVSNNDSPPPFDEALRSLR